MGTDLAREVFYIGTEQEGIGNGEPERNEACRRKRTKPCRNPRERRRVQRC